MEKHFQSRWVLTSDASGVFFSLDSLESFSYLIRLTLEWLWNTRNLERIMKSRANKIISKMQNLQAGRQRCDSSDLYISLSEPFFYLSDNLYNTVYHSNVMSHHYSEPLYVP